MELVKTLTLLCLVFCLASSLSLETSEEETKARARRSEEKKYQNACGSIKFKTNIGKQLMGEFKLFPNHLPF